MSLPIRQQTFVHAYAQSGNGAAAAVAAGYSARSAKVTASRLLTKANVLAAVRGQQALIAERLELSRDRVVAELQVAINIARMKGDAQAMVAAWREVSKLCGFYAAEARVVQMNPDIAGCKSRLERLSDAELLAMTAGESGFDSSVSA